jgi:ATP-dependent RNA helicase DOB1
MSSRSDNFAKVVAATEQNKTAPRGAAGSGGRGRRQSKGGNNAGKKGGDSDIFKVVKMLMQKNMEPAIVFAFSKRETESLALQMTKLDFNDEDEKALVEQVRREGAAQLTRPPRSTDATAPLN